MNQLDAFSRNDNELFELIVLHKGHASKFPFEIFRKNEENFSSRGWSKLLVLSLY